MTINIYDVIMAEMANDDESPEQISERLNRVYDAANLEQRHLIDDVLITLCGWSMESLRNKAKE